jgi:ATP-dependent DNA helicase RecQ
MPGDDDEAIWKYFDSMAFPREAKVRQVLAALGAAEGPITTPALETTVDLRRSRLEAMLKVLDVDGAVRRVKGGWLATGSPWEYDAERYVRVAEVRRHEQQAMRRYIATTDCRLEFLRQQLDDPEAVPCGRCDNCIHQPIRQETADTSVTAARRTLSQAGLTLEPKKLWPSNMDAFGIDVGGRIDPTEGAAPGRALARLTGVGLGGALRALLGEEDSDGEISDEMFSAVVDVMARWKEEWPVRPAAVVSIGSNRRPKLIASLAGRIAAIGHLPYLGEFTHNGPSAGAASNSAHRFRSVWGAYTLAPETEVLLGDHRGKAILLVDDSLDTGWTMTVVARQLRQRGAGLVYPLVLAVTF